MEPTTRTGVPVVDTIRVLRELAVGARNVVAGGRDVTLVRDDYIRWVEDAERQLRSRFVGEDVWRSLHSDRFWRVRELEATSPRPFPVIDHEARWQAERLEAIAELLEGGQQHLQVDAGCVPVVADTNIYVQYRRFDELDWQALVRAPSVRLVVPLLVLDELDDLSYRARSVGERAHSILRAMRALRGDVPPEQPVTVRTGVTMQVLMDPPGHSRLTNNDQEILLRVEATSALAGVAAVLATGDYAMDLRARSRSIRCVFMPEELRLPPRDPAPSSETTG